MYPIRGVIGVLTVAESVRQFLYPTLGPNVDVFQYRPKSDNGVFHAHDAAASTTDPAGCALFAPLPGTGNLFCNITDEETYNVNAYDPIPNFYYVKRDRNPLLVDSFIHQLIGVQRCWEMIKNHSAVTGTTYDWVVRTRPDVGFWMPLPFQNIRELPLHTLNVAYRGHGGCEDSFGIMSWSVATAFFERHKLMLKNGVSQGVPFEHALGCRAIHESVWDPEEFARCAVERAGFTLSYTPMLGYFVQRPGISTTPIPEVSPP